MCPRHTAKTRRHTAKTSSTVANGLPPTAATGMAKTVFAVCVYIGTRRKKASRRRHGQLTASAAVRRVPAPWTHGEHPGFAVCSNGRYGYGYGYRYAKICIFPTVSLSNGRRLSYVSYEHNTKARVAYASHLWARRRARRGLLLLVVLLSPPCPNLINKSYFC